MIFLIDLLFAKTVLFEKPKDTVKVDKIKKTRPVYQGNLPNYHRNGRQKVEFMALTSDKEELISHLFKDGSTYNIKNQTILGDTKQQRKFCNLLHFWRKVQTVSSALIL